MKTHIRNFLFGTGVAAIAIHIPVIILWLLAMFIHWEYFPYPLYDVTGTMARCFLLIVVAVGFVFSLMEGRGE